MIPPRLSVVAPAHNEAANLEPLVREIVATLDEIDISYEIVVADDGSTDETPVVIEELMRLYPQLRGIRMLSTPSGRGNGQSAAFHAGFRASRGDLIALLDADLQNDPADIPHLLDHMKATGADMVQGDRTASRQQNDGLIRSITSLVGRLFRRWILKDTVVDTGCSLRVMTRSVALALPLEYCGMHRFIPVIARQRGFRVLEMPVNHRPRVAGQSSYGVWNRALPGLVDCLAVRWMCHRSRDVDYEMVSSNTSTYVEVNMTSAVTTALPQKI